MKLPCCLRLQVGEAHVSACAGWAGEIKVRSNEHIWRQ